MGFKEKKAGKFLRQILEARQEPESDIQETVEIGFKGAGRINWSFWADAPWRIEPGGVGTVGVDYQGFPAAGGE